MMKGDIFVDGGCSFDSRMMNLGYGSSLSESRSIWGLFAWVFVFPEPIKMLDEFHRTCSPPILDPHVGVCLEENSFA